MGIWWWYNMVHLYMGISIYYLVGGDWNMNGWFFGISSSQLTLSPSFFQRGRAQPPTRSRIESRTKIQRRNTTCRIGQTGHDWFLKCLQKYAQLCALIHMCFLFGSFWDSYIYILFFLHYVLLSVHLYLGEYMGASYIFLRIPQTVWVGA
jgi:hypothetical protein